MNKKIAIALLTVCFVLASATVFAQRAGQSFGISHGIVESASAVNLNDASVLKGALVGGAWGSILTSSSKSSRRRDRNVAIGAVVGSARAANQQRPGMLYSVRMPDDSHVSIATEQTGIAVGDCVTIEQSGNSANIRRAAQAACEPESADVMNDPDVRDELEDDARECAAAKQELVDAETDEAMDRATRKIEILCYE